MAPDQEQDITIAILEPRELRLRGYQEALLSDPAMHIFPGSAGEAINDPSANF